MRIEAFKPQHLENLILQESQIMLQPLLADADYRESLFTAGPAYSAIVGDVVIASLGIIPQWENRATAWGLISNAAGKHFIGVTKAIKRFLELQDYRRIETPVTTNFAEGHRWAQLLGFQNEGTMRCYTPWGEDCDLYAKIRLDLA